MNENNHEHKGREIYIPRKFEKEIEHRLSDMKEEFEKFGVDCVERLIVWKMTYGWPLDKKTKEQHESDVIEIKKEFRLQLQKQQEKI